MIEAGVGPVGRAMAILALVSASTIVNIIFRVTVVAGIRRILERLVCVTINASNVLMLAD